MINRIDSLDWQRGLLALSIMLYHLVSVELRELDSSTLLGRMGIYGVAMFFVLSGLSMAYVYNNYIRDLRSSVNFFVRRIFRIWPLLWLAVLAVTAENLLLGKDPAWQLVVLNLTTAFGFISPGSYMNTGAWSIGNEMVYYALTPLIIYVYNKRTMYGNLLTALTLLEALFFSAILLTPEKSLAAQWQVYINPHNNLFLYFAGVAIYYNTGKSPFSKPVAGLLFALALATFVLYPAQGDQINIVTGLNRLVFCAASVILVLAFYKNSFTIPAIASKALTGLGLITYSVYLLHPLIHHALAMLFNKSGVQPGAYVSIALTVIATIMAASLSYKILEAPAIRLGKRLTSRKSDAPVTADGLAPAVYVER